jgi:molecular chaperone HscC
MSSIIGIDLGTTNSAVGVWRDNQPILIPNALGDRLTPSCVSIDTDGTILVGRPARDRLITHPERSAAHFKRYMGSNREIQMGGRVFRPEELSSLVLKSLKADADNFLGEDARDAVISVPAYFSDAQRKATQIAGQLAGLNVKRLVNEPTAAALAHGAHRRETESKFLVFDLGGGTFDVSVLDYFEGVMEVRASTGDNFLGGEDFTSVIAELFCTRNNLDINALPLAALHKLRQLAERAKIAMPMENPARTMEFSLDIDGAARTLRTHAAELERLFEPLLQRLRKPVERALRDAKIPVNGLDDVILVGGASRMPVVRKLVTQMFNRLPVMHLDPDEAIALGAAVQAGLLARDAGLTEIVLTDVTPYSLGIEVGVFTGPGNFSSGHFLPIIERNTVIPVSLEKQVVTAYDRQEALSIQIFQGESRLTQNNIALGELSIDVRPARAGEAGAAVRFTYDASGVLEVEATAFPGGEKRSLVIEKNPGVLTPEEIRQSLSRMADLKIHPRDQMKNRTLLARADRVYEELLGGERTFLAHQILEFQTALERQQPMEIERARKLLSGVLDSFGIQ